nr:hypothetical protein Iba_chr12dCG4440 [Ipomoea batatas]
MGLSEDFDSELFDVVDAYVKMQGFWKPYHLFCVFRLPRLSPDNPTSLNVDRFRQSSNTLDWLTGYRLPLIYLNFNPIPVSAK